MHSAANSNRYWSERQCIASTSFSGSMQGVSSDTAKVRTYKRGNNKNRLKHNCRVSKPFFKKNYLDEETSESGSLLSSRYYSDTELDESRQRWRNVEHYDREPMTTSCDESEALFQATSRKLRRTQSRSFDNATMKIRSMFAKEPFNRKCEYEKIDGHNGNSKTAKEINIKSKNEKDIFCKFYNKKDNNNIVTSTPNSKIGKETVKKKAVVKRRKARKHSASNYYPGADSQEGDTKARHYRQQKIADYYCATTRRRAQFHHFTTKDKDINLRKSRGIGDVLAASADYTNNNNNNNNKNIRSQDGNADENGINNGRGSGTDKDKLLKYNYPIYHHHHPHRRYRRHNHVYHQQEQLRQHKTPITTSVKRYNQQKRHCPKTSLKLYKTDNRAIFENAHVGIETCKAPVLLDIVQLTKEFKSNSEPGENSNLVNFNNNDSESYCATKVDSVLPLPLPLFPTVDSSFLSARRKCSCCQISNSHSSNEEIQRYKHRNPNFYSSVIDSGCMVDIELMSKIEVQQYSNTYNNDENTKFDQEDDETQFMNISDKIYENLLPLYESSPTAAPLANITNLLHNNAAALGSIITQPSVSSSNSSSGTDRSNCSSVINNHNYQLHGFATSAIPNDEPELYGQLVGAVIRDARQNQWQVGSSVSKAISEAQKNIEKFLCTKNSSCLSGQFAPLLPPIVSNCTAGSSSGALRLLTSDNEIFERECTALCALVAEKLRRTKIVSVRDYNDQIRWIQTIISRLKSVVHANGDMPIATKSLSQRPEHCFFINTAGQENHGGPLQKFIGKIRSIF